tara:strand:- start:573 stop:782 length:210 start_codon:yes stop_codon:yes gene_type:complete
MKPLPLLTTGPALLVLALLAGCGEDSVDDLDRIDAAPAAKVAADAIEPPEDERVLPTEADQNNTENTQY